MDCPHFRMMSGGHPTGTVVSCSFCDYLKDDSRFTVAADPQTGARYVTLRKGIVDRTIPLYSEGQVLPDVVLDLDAAGNVLGVEILP